MSHQGFCLFTLEKLIKDLMGMLYLIMKSTPIVLGGITLMAIGYEYNYRKVLGFIATEASGST